MGMGGQRETQLGVEEEGRRMMCCWVVFRMVYNMIPILSVPRIHPPSLPIHHRIPLPLPPAPVPPPGLVPRLPGSPPLPRPLRPSSPHPPPSPPSPTGVHPAHLARKLWVESTSVPPPFDLPGRGTGGGMGKGDG